MQNLCKNNFVCRLESPSEVYLQQNQEDATKNKLANSKLKVGNIMENFFFSLEKNRIRTFYFTYRTLFKRLASIGKK